MNAEREDLIQPAIADRVLLAVEWLNLRAETNGRGYVNGSDVKTAAALFSTDADGDEESVCRSLYRTILEDGEAA